MALKAALRQPEPLVLWLEKKRQDEGLSQRDFAAKLGIHESYWSFLRRGLRDAGRDILDRALALYPDLSYPYVQGLTISKKIPDDNAA